MARRAARPAARIEGPLLVAATVAICFASFGIVRRIGWMRPLFGLAPAGRAAAVRH